MLLRSAIRDKIEKIESFLSRTIILIDIFQLQIISENDSSLKTLVLQIFLSIKSRS